MNALELLLQPDTDGAQSQLQIDAAVEHIRASVNSFYDGMIAGVHLYAWWKNGVMYVGTTGKKFIDAVAEIEQERVLRLSNIAITSVLEDE
jgi:hypothetical protein